MAIAGSRFCCETPAGRSATGASSGCGAVATRGAKSANEVTEEGPALDQRWVMRAPQTGAPRPRPALADCCAIVCRARGPTTSSIAAPPFSDASHRLSGKAWENGYCESFNGRMRDEVLNGEIFYSLREAQILIEQWRRHYNTQRPHSSLGYRPPAPEAIVPIDLRPFMN